MPRIVWLIKISIKKSVLKFVWVEEKDFSGALIALCLGEIPKGRQAVCVGESANLTQTDGSAILFPKKKRKIISKHICGKNGFFAAWKNRGNLLLFRKRA